MAEHSFRKLATKCGILVFLAAATLVLVRCGSSNSPATGMGTSNVSLSDPPSCTTFSHVYVTIDEVSANISSTSGSGFQPLVSQINSTSSPIKAVQVDLMNLPQAGQCLLAQLGSNTSLPAGSYQQIRLLLVDNSTASSNVNLIAPSVGCTGSATSGCTNECGGAGWNCVVVKGSGSPAMLDLSSEAQTGLKIPPGQVLGGPIDVAAGKSVDINVDFNACRSVLQEGNGQFRLKPTLVGYVVSQNNTGISGQIVQGTVVSNALTVTTNPVANANVALELATPPTDGATSVDLIGNYLQQTDSSGNFDFCPLPTNLGAFDIVADAGAGNATAGGIFNATIVTTVGNGNQVTVPLLAETGTAPATLNGIISATLAASGPTSAAVDMFALQSASSSLEFAVPLLEPGSTDMVSVACTGTTCTATSNNYTLIVPASNPLVGAFSGGKITWTLPAAAPPIPYKAEATCTGASGNVAVFSSAQNVTAGSTTTVTPALATLSGCTE